MSDLFSSMGIDTGIVVIILMVLVVILLVCLISTNLRLSRLELQKNFQRIFSKYGVEKYDAFDDVGGKLSFALAMLDKNNSGLVLNAVHSRDNCFLYLKEIVKGESYVMLSQEEVEALRRAVNYGIEDLEEVTEKSKKDVSSNQMKKE